MRYLTLFLDNPRFGKEGEVGKPTTYVRRASIFHLGVGVEVFRVDVLANPSRPLFLSVWQIPLVIECHDAFLAGPETAAGGSFSFAIRDRLRGEGGGVGSTHQNTIKNSIHNPPAALNVNLPSQKSHLHMKTSWRSYLRLRWCMALKEHPINKINTPEL